MNLPSLEALRALCEAAGRDILSVRRGEGHVSYKLDGSPLTAADMAAQQRLADGLPGLLDVPILSEEQAETPWPVRRHWRCYWLVDPLDGTREFVDGFDDFTVNVALIQDGGVVVGMVHAPALGSTWAGGSGLGAWRWESGARESISVSVRSSPSGGSATTDEPPLRILASRAHLDAGTREWLAGFPAARLSRCGSSVKFCRIAEGTADLYPRFGPTCEWDTAAGQGVLEGAGGAVLCHETGAALCYNARESLINGPFVACGDVTRLVPTGT
ncbi:3'(2'),5'-bisphosphate nucleotidase CysQ [Billgrantia endophytica]|uniref:3'(2'),5'-bisphosphate nucleotidase CysQ n=1 Tax=Billgrantia endophytica TaxID=2033802 RepID=UPI0013FE0616|nr:3'(2'),5'-bisphosphate nucleotidase CysQ [Halomonas endophytica]